MDNRDAQLEVNFDFDGDTYTDTTGGSVTAFSVTVGDDTLNFSAETGFFIDFWGNFYPTYPFNPLPSIVELSGTSAYSMSTRPGTYLTLGVNDGDHFDLDSFGMAFAAFYYSDPEYPIAMMRLTADTGAIYDFEFRSARDFAYADVMTVNVSDNPDFDAITSATLTLRGWKNDAGTLATSVNTGNANADARSFQLAIDNVRISNIFNPPPIVTSIDRATPASAATDADSLVYQVSFSEPVSNVDAADFSVTGSTATVTDVAALSVNVYNVTVSGGNLANLNGSVTLGFAGDQDITDTAGTALIDTTPTGTHNASYTVDNAAPDAPGAPDLTDDTDSGSSHLDNLTRDTTPTFSGTAEAGSTVTLYDTDGTTVLGSGVATDGNWAITTSALSNGEHILTATATDAVGHVSAPSSGLDLSIDTQAPTLAITSSVNALEVGEAATISFTFSDDPGASFTADDIAVSGGTLSALSSSGAVRTATFTPTADTKGSASITVAAAAYTDAAGNSGAAGTTPSLSFNTVAPATQVNFDFDGDTYTNTTGGSVTAFSVTAGDDTLNFSAETGFFIDFWGNFYPLYPFNPLPNIVELSGTSAYSMSTRPGTYLTLGVNDGDHFDLDSFGMAFAAYYYADSEYPIAMMRLTADTGAIYDFEFRSALDFGYPDVMTVNVGDNADFDAITSATLTLRGWKNDAGTLATSVNTGNANADARSFQLAIDNVRVSNIFTPDVSAPTVAHVDRATPAGATTNADSLVYQVVFNEVVNNVDAADFSVTGSTATVTDVVAISGNVYNVTVSGGDLANLNGNVTLGFAGGQNITDATGNALASTTPTGTNNATYTLDNTGLGAPSAPDLRADSDQGSSDTDDLTSDTTPTFTGTAEAGSTVTLYDTDGTTVLGSGIATGGNWAITTSVLSNGKHTLTATASDAAGNESAASPGLDVSIDAQAPTVTISSNVSMLKSGETATISFTFSEDPGADFDNGDIAVSGGTLGTLSGTGTLRTAIFTPTTSTNGGTASITVEAGIYTDAAGNGSSAGTTPSLSFDTLAPAAPSTPDLAAGSDSGASDTDNQTRHTTPTFTGTAESGSTVTLYDTDGTTVLGTTIATGGSWTITTIALDENTHSISARAVDAAGNHSTASTALDLSIDTAAPTVAITSNKNALKIGDTATLTFTFSEDPGASFTVDDIAVSGGTLSNFSGTGTSRTALYAPDANKSEAVTIGVAAGNYSDGAGNTGEAGELELTINTLRPTASIFVTDAALSAGETSLVTITFSEAVTGFTNADLIARNGTLSTVATSDGGITWTTTFTPTTNLSAATNAITLDNTGVMNLAGNAGTGTTDSNHYAIDTKRPTVTIAVADSALGANETALVTLTFSEAVTGLTSADLIVTGGSVDELASADGGITWTTTFTPDADVSNATSVITLDNTGVTDSAGNTGTGSTDSNRFAIDTLAPDAPPLPVLAAASDLGSSDSDQLTHDTTPTFAGSAGADVVSVTLYEGSTVLGSIAPDEDGVWSITSTALGEGQHMITATATDAAGNESTASQSLEVNIDLTSPTLAITSDQSALNAGESATITFSFSEDPGASFDNTDIAVSGGTLGTLSGTGTTRTALFTPTANLESTINISVAVGAYSDAAGNDGGSTRFSDIAIDTLAPAKPWALGLDTASDLGSSTTDRITSDTTPTLSGLAEAGSSVTLFDGSTELGTVSTSSKGLWSITSSALSEGQHTLTAVTIDEAGNASEASASLIVDIDVTAPTLAITSDKSILKAGESATLTFTFSEDPGSSITWDGKINDVARSGGTLSNLSGSGTTYTATFTPDGNTDNGSASISVAAGAYSDAAGNSGGAGLTPGISFDTKAPTLTITSDQSTLNAGDSATITFTFSEDPGASFDDTDITVSGGTLSALGGSGAVRTATFTPDAATGSGTANITVAAGTYTDAIGNSGDAGATPAISFDTLGPVVTHVVATTADGSYTTGATISIQLSFSEAVKVTGTPQLLLDTGTTDHFAHYTTGDGTDTLTFTYTVQADDASSDLDYADTEALALNGGTIRDRNGNEATLTLPAPGTADSLSENKAIMIDAVAPTFANATIDGATLVLTYADAGALDATHPPLPDSFAVMNGARLLAATKVAVDSDAKTITLTLDSAVMTGDLVTLSYADPHSGDDAQAIQDALGNDAAALVAVAVSNTTAPVDEGNGGNKGITETVDGVEVTTTTTTENGIAQTVFTIQPVPPTRAEDSNTPNGGLADVPLVQSSTGETLLQIGLPSGVGVTAAGAATPTDTTLGLREQLIAAAQPRLSDAAFAQVLQDGIERYVAVVEDPTQVAVRTLTLTQGASAPTQPIVITGAQGTGENDATHPLRQEALVIDARNLPAGTVIQLDQVEFAVVIGDVTVHGGDGRNYVFGNGDSQTLFLGADDDELHGGGGDDVVASSQGDDHLFGDDGADRVIGGIGNDVLEGGAGDDVLQGGASSAGSWSFGIGADGQLLSHFTPRDALLAAPGDQHGSHWAYDPVNDILADSRVAFMQAPVAHLATVAALYKAVTQNLPTIAELNQLAALGQNPHSLAEMAYAAYARQHPASADLTDEIRALITHVLGAEAATSALVQQGLEFLQSGGARADALLYLVNDARFQAGMKDVDGTFHLAQNLEVNELDWDATSGNDVLRGGDGNDVLAGGSGGDLLDGGAGSDTAVLKLSAAHYTLSLDAAANVVLHNQTMGESDVLVSVEFLQFGDEVFALDLPAQPTSPHQPLADFLRPATDEELLLIGVHHEA